MDNNRKKLDKSQFSLIKFLKPIYYIGLAVAIWILCQLTPGIADELIAEIVLIVFIAGTEIHTKIKASKNQDDVAK